MNFQLIFKTFLALMLSQILFGCSQNSSNSSSVTPSKQNSNTQQGEGTPAPATPPTNSTPGNDTNTNQPGNESASCQAALVGKLPAGSLSINSGENFTQSKQVQLNLNHSFVSQMKISNTPDCKCGDWEPYSQIKSWVLTNTNKLNVLSVQFKDYDGVPTECTSAQISHDDQSPKISITADANNLYFNNNSQFFNYTVSDIGSGVKAVSCLVDTQILNCSIEGGKLTTTHLSAGLHTITVKASDKLDQKSVATLNFTIKNPAREITQNKEITAENKVDILVVVDNSPSMQDIQKNMAKRVSSLMDQVKNLDYRIAITTTDPSNKITGDGKLLSLEGFSNQYVITPAMGLANAQNALANTVQRREVGSVEEQGIYATYRVIERALASEVNHAQFFRPDAAFSVILISDANESASSEKNKPQNLINLVKKNWPLKKFIFNSIIVKPNDSVCFSQKREAYGTIYDNLSKLLGYGTVGGSIIGSVCATDYGSQLSGIGESVQQLVKIMDLECAPIGESSSSVTVIKDGSNYSDSYEVQGLKVVFHNNLPAGKYTLTYKCAP